MSVAQASENFLIREPRESEVAAFRMLLPDAAAHPAGLVCRLVLDPTNPRIAAALSYLDDSRSLTNMRLHVVKTRRKSGVGSWALNYVVDEARRLGRERVFADTDMKKEPDAEVFLTKRGFHRVGRLTSVRGPLLTRGPKAALLDQLVAKAQEFPPDSRLVNIADAPPDQILALYSDHIANVPMVVDMRRSFQPERYKESIVVMVGDRVIGFLLANVSAKVVHVPALVVVPEYRGRGMTNRMVRILEDRLGDTVDCGEFDFTDAAPFTAKLAAEFGHEVLRIAARFERVIS